MLINTHVNIILCSIVFFIFFWPMQFKNLLRYYMINSERDLVMLDRFEDSSLSQIYNYESNQILTDV
jgi:hypothetical protein